MSKNLDIRVVLPTIPEHDTVLVKYHGIYYTADDLAIMHLQVMVAKGKLDPKDIKVLDINNHGEEYELIWNQDGSFYNEFTCNIRSAVPDAAWEFFDHNN